MNYEWMLKNGRSAQLVKDNLIKEDLKEAFLNFIYLVKMGYTEQELRNFVEDLFYDVSKEKKG